MTTPTEIEKKNKQTKQLKLLEYNKIGFYFLNNLIDKPFRCHKNLDK